MAKKAKTAPAKVTRQLTPEADLNRLLKQCSGHMKNIAEITGSLREKIAYAVDKKHLHKKAFSTVRSLDRMEPEALAAFFDHFDHYCDVGGLRERANDAPALELEDGEGEGQTEGGEPGNGKVARPKFGDREAAPG